MLTKSKPYLIGYSILLSTLKGKASLVANRPALFVPLDCKAIPLLWLVSALLLDLGTPVP